MLLLSRIGPEDIFVLLNWNALLTTETATHRCFNQFQSSVVFHTENSHLFYRTKQMTGFYMKRNTGLKRVNK